MQSLTSNYRQENTGAEAPATFLEARGVGGGARGTQSPVALRPCAILWHLPPTSTIHAHGAHSCGGTVWNSTSVWFTGSTRGQENGVRKKRLVSVSLLKPEQTLKPWWGRKEVAVHTPGRTQPLKGDKTVGEAARSPCYQDYFSTPRLVDATFKT